MRVSVEAPEGWGPTRLVIVQLERLGYQVAELRMFDVPGGRTVLVIT